MNSYQYIYHSEVPLILIDYIEKTVYDNKGLLSRWNKIEENKQKNIKNGEQLLIHTEKYEIFKNRIYTADHYSIWNGYGWKRQTIVY